jgi:hypothetical protein
MAVFRPVFPNLWGIASNFGYCDPMVTGRHSTLSEQIGRTPEIIGKYRLLTINWLRSTSKPTSEDVSQGAKLLGFYEPT